MPMKTTTTEKIAITKKMVGQTMPLRKTPHATRIPTEILHQKTRMKVLRMLKQITSSLQTTTAVFIRPSLNPTMHCIGIYGPAIIIPKIQPLP